METMNSYVIWVIEGVMTLTFVVLAESQLRAMQKVMGSEDIHQKDASTFHCGTKDLVCFMASETPTLVGSYNTLQSVGDAHD